MLFENTARVPRIIYSPDSPTPKRSTELAELVDVYPTLVGLANLPAPPAGSIDGVDLSAVVLGSAVYDAVTAPIKSAAYSQYRCPPTAA